MESRGRRRPEVPGVPPPVMGKTQGAGTLLQQRGPQGRVLLLVSHQQGRRRVSLDP